MRVHAASVDRGTWHVMAGLPYPIRLAGFGLRRPKYRNPGRSLAGTVEAVGADATGFKPGDEVFGICDGSFAEYARVRTDKLAPKPANLSFEQAAAVPISGLTALQAVRDHGRVQAGQKVLIVGASGGVGSFAVQIAKAFGAEVTGVCSTAKVDAVRALGADHVIDYTSEDFADGKHRYDVILDIGGNRRLSASAARAHSRGTARHRRRRDRRTLARRHRPSDPGARAVAVRRPEAGHVRRLGERRRPDRPRASSSRPARSHLPSTGPTRSARSPRRSATCSTGTRAARSSSAPFPSRHAHDHTSSSTPQRVVEEPDHAPLVLPRSRRPGLRRAWTRGSPRASWVRRPP